MQSNKHLTSTSTKRAYPATNRLFETTKRCFGSTSVAGAESGVRVVLGRRAPQLSVVRMIAVTSKSVFEPIGQSEVRSSKTPRHGFATRPSRRRYEVTCPVLAMVLPLRFQVSPAGVAVWRISSRLVVSINRTCTSGWVARRGSGVPWSQRPWSQRPCVR